MENTTAENLYLIDLSYATTPADIVFELSSIIEQDMARNQKIKLKLGDVSLNQSQLLSIKSLINSINSSLVLLSSDSKQTELAAMTLGFIVDNNQPEEKPAEQYIPMTEHIEEQKFEKNTDEISAVETEEITTDIKDETEYIKEHSDADATSATEETPAETAVISEPKKNESLISDEEVQEQLDSIFDSEQKLEQIFGSNEEQETPIAGENEEQIIDEKLEIEVPKEEEYTEEDYAIAEMNTKYYKQTVRSGQVINFDGNVVIIGDCHPGCEISASGDITVWGVLSGIAHAGCKGNSKARIRALNLNAIQLRIANLYARRPDTITSIYIEKTNSFTPEEARILNDSIVILRINEQ